MLGEVVEHDVKILELAALKGLFSALVQDPVSYVNAPVFATDRGIEVSLRTDPESPQYRNEVRVRLVLSDGRRWWWAAQ